MTYGIRALGVHTLGVEALDLAGRDWFGSGGGGGGGLAYVDEFTALSNTGDVNHPIEGYTISDLLVAFGGGRVGPTLTWSEYTWSAGASLSQAGQAFGSSWYRTSAEVITEELLTMSFARNGGFIILAIEGGAYHLGGSAGASSTTITCPDITTTTDGCRIFRFLGSRSLTSITGWPTGTVLFTQGPDGDGGIVSLVDAGIQTSAGATGTATFTGSVSGFGVGLTLAIAPV